MTPPPETASHTSLPGRKHLDLLQGVALGTIYGVLLRGYMLLVQHLQQLPGAQGLRGNAAEEHAVRVLHGLGDASQVMTIAFLVLGPLVIGLLTVRRIERTTPTRVGTWITAPWLAVICMMAIIALFAWEGAICVLMAFPLTLLFASIGGVVAGITGRRHRLSMGATACVAVLPVILAPAETLLPAPTQARSVENTIVIHASPEVVWRNIERVPAISPTELKPNWTHRIGFPRPVEATLSYEGVGGVRHASFEHGLLFVETIDTWQPNHRLGFSIHADTAAIPPTTLDEHVTIGGRYFDVLHGEYRLEPLADGSTLLHLSSQERLSTDFNGYAGLWSDAVMSSLQSSILQVIQHRSEHSGG